VSNISAKDSLVETTQGYFYTDWSAMTSHDWAGMIVTVVTFVFMAIAYFYVFRPKNKDKLESQKYSLLNEQSMDELSVNNEGTNTEKK
jgi:cytochrome c oxidase cbb3-type subunit IV